MKIIHYRWLLTGLFFMSSIHQIAAFNTMPQEDQQQVHASIDDNTLEYMPYETEHYTYSIDQQKESVNKDLDIKSFVVSDIVVDNYYNSGITRTLITQRIKRGSRITTTQIWKSKNPSYFTFRNGALALSAVAIVALAYIALRAYKTKLATDMENYLKKEEMLHEQGAAFSDLQSDAARVLYLKNLLKHTQVAQDFNFDVVAYYLQNQTVELTAEFFGKLDELVTDNPSHVISMDDVDQAFSHVAMHSLSDQIGASLFPDIDKKTLQDRSNIVENMSKLSNLVSPEQQVAFAYHEAGHALMTALQSKNIALTQFSLKPQGFLGAAVMTMPLSKDMNNSVEGRSQRHDEMIAEAKSDIMMLLSGGIGHELLDGKRLSYEDFLEHYGSEIGNYNVAGTDMHQALQKAVYYTNVKDYILVSKYQEDIEPYPTFTPEEIEIASVAFIKDCYEEAYTILSAHKKTLDKIVAGTLKEGVTSGDKIYGITDRQRAKYAFELTSAEKTMDTLTKWLSWTSKRMNFYDRNSPQF